MEFREYLSVLRARWTIIVGCALILTILAAVLAFRAPRVYSAQASVFFSVSVGENTRELSSGFSYVEGLVSSYAEVVTQPVVLNPVIAELDLDTTPRALARSIDAQTPLDTVLLDIRVTETAPERAAAIANEITRQLTLTVGNLVPGSPSTSAPVRVTVVSPATVPTSPSSPRITLNLTLGLVGGLLLGIMLAFVRDVLDARIGGRRDVERVTDVPVIGEISAPETGRRKPLFGRRNLSEDRAKELRTNFQHVRVKRRLRSVVFTSAQDDRATALTVSSLGMELAQAGISTVLVDADLRKPSLGPWFGFDEPVGLSSVLLGEMSWRDAVRQRGRIPLAVLPAGPPPSDPGMMLHPALISGLIAELADNYDVVLIKAPPVLRVADGLLFCRIADGTVVVADGPRMNRNELAEEVHVLAVADALVLGIVLMA